MAVSGRIQTSLAVPPGGGRMEIGMDNVHGGDVYRHRDCIDFSANCNPLGTPERVKEAVRKSAERLFEYPQVGSLRLREAIGKAEQVPGERVFCGNGAAEIIFLLCRALEPEQALVCAPTFAEYEQALKSTGASVSRFCLPEERDFVLDEENLEAFLGALKGKNICFLCNPNNPTGMLTDRSILLRILAFCREEGIFLVADECFLDFVKDPDAYTLKAYLPEYENLLILKAFTKRYGMAGLRLGYALCANEGLYSKMEAVSQPWNVSTPAQEAGIAALSETAFAEKGREIVFREAAYLREAFLRLGIHFYPSAANYFLFRGPENLYEECIKRGILLRDCSNYPGLSRGFYRTAVKTHNQNEALIRVLSEFFPYEP